MKEILSARKALDACLMISALLVEVQERGRCGDVADAWDGVASAVVVAAGERRDRSG